MMSPMAKPVDATERALIVERIKAGDTCGQIARSLNRSKNTISTVARHAGVAHMFDRSATKKATEDRNADIADRRSRCRLKLLILAEREIDEFNDEHTERRTFVVAKGGGVSAVETVDVKLGRKTPEQKRATMGTISMALQSSDRLGRTDDAGQVNAKGMLERLVDGLEQVAA